MFVCTLIFVVRAGNLCLEAVCQYTLSCSAGLSRGGIQTFQCFGSDWTGLDILNHQIMEYWKTTVTILLPLLANIFSYWGLLRSGGLNTRKYWLVEVRRPQYEKILASRGDWEWLYCDSSRGIRWNIAWALGKSLGLRPRDFPRAQAIFHRMPLLSSQYSYNLWHDKWRIEGEEGHVAAIGHRGHMSVLTPLCHGLYRKVYRSHDKDSRSGKSRSNVRTAKGEWGELAKGSYQEKKGA